MVRIASFPIPQTVLLACASAILASCGGEKKTATVLLVNDPGKVEMLNPPNTPGNEFWTTFTIKPSTHPTAIASPGTGGACPVADLNGFGVPVMPAGPRNCTKNADCQGGLGIPGTPMASWFGYCDIDGDKKCWVRPGPPLGPKGLCNISGIPRPLNQVIETPHVPLDPFKAQFPGPVRWRTVACLNGYTAGKANADCKLTDGGVRREVIGTPRVIQ